MNFCQEHEGDNALISPQVADLPQDLKHSKEVKNIFIWIYFYVYVCLVVISCLGIHFPLAPFLEVRNGVAIKYPS